MKKIYKKIGDRITSVPKSVIHNRIYRAIENNIKAKWRMKMQERGGPNYMFDVYLIVVGNFKIATSEEN